jgi:hypothetical protein
MVFPLLRQSAGGTKNSKSQITNIKWFDKLTTLSLVEGQITMTKIRNSKLVLCFGHLKLGTRPQGGESGGPILEFEICL